MLLESLDRFCLSVLLVVRKHELFYFVGQILGFLPHYGRLAYREDIHVNHTGLRICGRLTSSEVYQLHGLLNILQCHLVGKSHFSKGLADTNHGLEESGCGGDGVEAHAF